MRRNRNSIHHRRNRYACTLSYPESSLACAKLGKKISKVSVLLEPGEVYTSDFDYSSERASRKMGYKQKQEVSQSIAELADYAFKMRAH